MKIDTCIIDILPLSHQVVPLHILLYCILFYYFEHE